MQKFPCPFCGERDEREFHFGGEAGKSRPKTTGDVTDVEWRDYLFAQKNVLGLVREIWVHLPCQEVFLMERDTKTMEVLGHGQLRKDTR
ncbi:MAG: sarcosine oxidase subunit delta [Sedimentitalea sp.]